ncbi:unnamed protein product [Closterium sp. NIES-53]
MKRAVAAGADVYAVDIAIVEEANKSSDFQKLLAAVPSELQELLKRFPRIFPDDLPEGLPPQRAHDHRIELEPGAQPTVQRQFRLTQPELHELRKQLDYLLEKKFIRPSSSPFAAPILFTPKKDGGFRVCIDYRALNRVTVKSRYPIPCADELIDQLRTARVFLKIDLPGGYLQIRVEPSDCAKTAFRTRYGSFEYTVMPFGLTNAPATFQMTMNEAFRPLLDTCVIIYLDDILVYSRDKQQHLVDLEEVFTILDKQRLLTKGSKCEFFQDRLEFLGHVISEAGVEIDPKKLDTVKAWHHPTNITELQSFLGFVNYVRRFVPDMARLTAPLTDLLRKGVTFTWGEKEHAAFSTLENVLCSPPVLHIADPHRPFEVVTDANDIAIGAVLLQDFGNGLQPIAYESRKLHPPEKYYPIHDREMLAIVHAFKVWRCYLTGADVTGRTYHKSLQYLRVQPHLNPRQIRWLDYLESNFHYTVTYRKGASNIADALTRPTAQVHTILFAQTSPLLTGLFSHGYQTYPFFTGENSQQFAAARGVYYVKAGTDRIWVPGYTLLRELLLQEAHDGVASGHFGVEKTRQQLQRYYYWPEMLTDVQRHVASCPTCQVMKSSRKRPAGQLQPIPPPERAWQQVTMDFVTGLPVGASGNDAILVVVDRLTKMAHFAACKKSITAEETARLFIATIVRLHGIPTAIISDRDTKFTSNFWHNLWQQFGTRLQFSSSYHPETDGQIERTDRTDKSDHGTVNPSHV